MIRRPRHEDSMLPVGKALIGSLALSGVVGFDVLPAVESSPVGSALHGRKVSGIRVLTGLGRPPPCDSLLRPLLTPRRAARAGSPQVRTRWLPSAVCASLRLPARPPHLPPRLVPLTSRCCASSSNRIGLDMRFPFDRLTALSGVEGLSIGPPVSPSVAGRVAPCRPAAARALRALLPPVGCPSGVGFEW